MDASPKDRLVPAAGRSGLTRAYDAAVALTMRERRWRPALVTAVLDGVPPGGVVVDVGAGTGTLAIALALARPDVEVWGVDADPEVRALAVRKPGAEAVRWAQGLADSLPVGAGAADRVVMSLLLHHLTPGAKRLALAEAHRVLRPGGRLHVADWGRPGGPLLRVAFAGLRLLDGLEVTREHAEGRLAEVIAEAGFARPARHARLRTVWGTLEVLAAERP